MPERAVFLDRDNTIIENDGYLGDAARVKLLPGAATALSAIRALGYRLIVVSNQSGVARGMFAETDVEAVNQEMCRQLREQAAAHIDASYYCPYHPDAVVAEYKIDHDWRKPKPGMLTQAAADFNLDLSQSWMIGDQPRDIFAGAAAGCRTILLADPSVVSANTAASQDAPSADAAPNFVVRTLADAARIIAREGKSPHPSSQPAAISPPSVAPVEAKPLPPVAPLPSAPATLAERLARQTPAPPPPTASSPLAPSSKLEKNLEDLLNELRHQNRKAEAPADFSRLKGGAVLLQIFAVLSLLIGFYRMASAGANFQTWEKIALTVTNLESAAIFVMAAVVLQLIVVALLLFSRDR